MTALWRCLLALNGPRISEALGADMNTWGVVRGHRTLTVTRKGGAIVTIPLAPRTGRAIDLCIGERDRRPILMNRDATYIVATYLAGATR